MDPDTGSGASTNRSFMDTLASEKHAVSEEEHKQQHDPIQPRQHIGQPDNDDDSDEEEEIVGHLDPQHPLMDRLQAALFRQLSQEDDRLELELREKREALTQAQTTVTSVGESLYQHQARLAKMQMDLQKTNQAQQEQEKARTTAELLLKERMVQYQEKMRQRQELESKRIAAQRELDHLLITVQQIDDYNQKVKSEILVTRRAAYGTEESMQHLEKENSRAQTLIDGLNTQISNNEEQIRLYVAQITNQKQETQQAQATLEEAAKEMELIAVEKREYLQKWRTSIVGMRNRDEALEAAYASADAQRQTLQNLELSLSGYKSAIRQEQIENEKLTAILNRVEAETRFMDQQLQAIADTKKNLNNKHTVLRASLERVESALKSALQTQREIRAEIDALHKAHEKLMSEKQEIDDTIMEHLNSQTTLEKGAQNVWKLTQKLKQQVHEKEIQMGEINNEVARIKVDTLNTGAHNKELQATLAAYDHELKEKDKLIEKYELEIRQRHDKIEKKQIYIARLNRKFETLTTNIQEENTGPLEATIANLSKEIIQTTREVSDMQREWIKSQTELVGLVSDTSEVDEHVTQQRARAVVLQQKHTRINNQFHSLKEEIKELEYGIKTMHHDLTTFNHQIATAVRRQEELANSNYTMEIDHMEKLKEREQETVKMNATTERLHLEYASLRDEIIAVEQEIMLWEKKIQLERETQEALDPEYGQPEIKGMKKEIHRMRLRLQQLKREQEKLIQQGEKTIMKRPMVSITRSTKANAQMTEAALQKEIQKIQNSLQEDSKAQEKITYEIQQQMLACEELSAQLKRHQDEYGIIESRKIELQQEIQQQSLLAAVNDARVMVLQHHGQAHATEVKRALSSSSDQGEVKRKPSVKDKKEKIASPANEQEKLAQLQRQQQQYEAALAREQSRFESLQHLISSQCDPENNPKYHEWFKRLYAQIPNLNT